MKQKVHAEALKAAEAMFPFGVSWIAVDSLYACIIARYLERCKELNLKP